jgi:hypothetical protein
MPARVRRYEERPAVPPDHLELFTVGERLGERRHTCHVGARSEHSDGRNRARHFLIAADVVVVMVGRENRFEVKTATLDFRQDRCRFRAIHDRRALAGRVDQQIAVVVGQ